MKLNVMRLTPQDGHKTTVLEQQSEEAKALPFDSPVNVVIATGTPVHSYEELLAVTAPYEGQIEQVDVYVMPKMTGG
jgi:hypothetical protein